MVGFARVQECNPPITIVPCRNIKFMGKYLKQSLKECNYSITNLNVAFMLHSSTATVSDEEMQEHYDNFFEEVFVECEDRYGEIEEMNVCDNLGDHLVGNVYIKVGTSVSWV